MSDHDDFQVLLDQLAKAIKTARKTSDLSQEALALSASVDRTYVSQLERGVANPSLLILFRIAKELDVKMKIEFEPRTEGNSQQEATLRG